MNHPNHGQPTHGQTMPGQTTQRQVTQGQESNTAVIEPNVNAISDQVGFIDFEADAGAGMEDIGKEDMQIPFIKILQSNDPFVKPKHDKYISGAIEGMIINTVTKRLYPGDEGAGIVVIPCMYERKHVEWIPKDNGGGYVGAHDIESGIIRKCKRNDKNRDILPNGHEIIDTAYHFVLLLDPENPKEFEPVVVNMSRTQMKVSRNWNTLLKNSRMTLPNRKKIQPPCYATMWRLTTVGESSKEYSWCNWKVEFEGFVSDPVIYETAKAFRESIIEGAAKAAVPEDYEYVEDPEPGTDDGEAPTEQQTQGQPQAQTQGYAQGRPAHTPF